jgi:uncharacterized protein (TIGR00296 family)
MTVGEIKAYAAYAFDALVAHLKNRKPRTLSEFLEAIPGRVITGEAPLFVTWNTVDPSQETEEGELRGCIGTFEPQDLERGIKQYSLIAGLQDPRFPAISGGELDHLECAVTVLSQFEKVSNPLDWEVGKHGVKGVFTTGNGRRTSATFLPDVAAEQGWDQKTTLKHLAMKAGVPSTCDVAVTRYQGIKSGIRYREYVEIVESLP